MCRPNLIINDDSVVDDNDHNNGNVNDDNVVDDDDENLRWSPFGRGG